MKKLILISMASFALSLTVYAKDEHSKPVTAPPADAHTAHHDSVEGMAPEKAMGLLKTGNAHFIKEEFRKDGASKADVQRLSGAQHPHTIVLSCSDSRVPPEVVFDQKLGEIFVIRTAGEALEPIAIGSIEYAVEHLGVKNIVVMGHTQCGAVKAALSTLDGKDAGSPNLNKLVADIHPRLQSFAKKPASENFSSEGWANSKGVAKDLLGRSELLAKAVKAGKLKVSSALYNLHSGIVDFE